MPKSLPQIKVNINCFKFVDLEWKFDKPADFSLLSKLILSPYAIVDMQVNEMEYITERSDSV